jgi:hypothetical protein
MAVLVDFAVQDATPEQMYQLEALTQARGEAAGGPPYAGCMFIACVPDGTGFRFTSAWRREEDFRAVLEEMLGPDAATVGLEVVGVTVTPVLSMGIPG